MSRSYRFYPILSALLWRGLLLWLLWWLLAEGGGGQGFAVATALLAALLSLPLLPPVGGCWSWRRVVGLLRFVPFFIYNSLLGGWDVARRALHPRLPLAPRTLRYPMRLPPGWPRVIFLNTISLMPGTLAVKMEGAVATIHLLDGSGDPLPALRRVERRVAALFGSGEGR
ncbi:MAG: Na+/H+ antiporter subunit E [Pseudomonadota bacterium]